MENKSPLLILAGTLIIFSACQSSTTQTPQQASQSPSTQNAAASASNSNKILVDEVLQTSNYTYLHGKEGTSEQWFAVPSMQAKAGDTYYYTGGLVMNKFQSKELNRTFESVIFLDGVSTQPNGPNIAAAPSNTEQTAQAAPTGGTTAADNPEKYTRSTPVIEKADIKMKAAEGGVTIADLYSKKESYAGKTVKVKGKVTKYTPAIMNKNWIHIQDGTEANGKFDFVLTTTGEANVGDIITVEGKIGLNKDLGYGYFFEVIMEDAKIK